MPKQNIPPSDYPQAVLQQIEQLARHITIARKRRGETQAQWARKLGVSQPTMARIERGDPSVAMASYVMCMWLIRPDHALAEVISPGNDQAALEREVSLVTAKKRKSNVLGRKRTVGVDSALATASAGAATTRSVNASGVSVMQAGHSAVTSEGGRRGKSNTSVTDASGKSVAKLAEDLQRTAGLGLDRAVLEQSVLSDPKSSVDQYLAASGRGLSAVPTHPNAVGLHALLDVGKGKSS